MPHLHLSCFLTDDDVFIPETTVNVPVNLGFLFDGSGEISHPDFLAQISLAKKVADTFNVSDGLAQVGAATFASESKVHFTFDNPLSGPKLTLQAVHELLDKIPHDQGPARIGLGLQTVDVDLFSQKGGITFAPKVRFSSKRRIILMVNGRKEI